MSKNYQRYSEEFKLSVIRDYYSSGMTKYSCRRKYHLRSGGTLLNWLRKYENEKKVVSLHPELKKKLYLCIRNPQKTIWQTAAKNLTRKKMRI